MNWQQKEFWEGTEGWGGDIELREMMQREWGGLKNWALFPTSGSSGAPRWVLLNKQAFLISARSVNAHFNIQKTDRILNGLSLKHVGGFAWGARAYLSGASLEFYEDKWSPRMFYERLMDQRITLTSLVPTQLHDLIQFVAPKELRIVMVGGAALSESLKIRALQQGWNVYETYGMTESASQIATERYEAGADIKTRIKLMSEKEEGDRSAWLEVLPHWQVQLNEAGVLVLEGRSKPIGYLEKKQCWQLRLMDSSLLWVTEDRVDLREQGLVQEVKFICRANLDVKIKGEWVNIEWVENNINRVWEMGEENKNWLVTLIDEPREGRALVLCGEMAEDFMLEGLRLYNQGVEPLQKIHWYIKIKKMPRSVIGKIRRTEVQKMISMQGCDLKKV
jgi:O-succinylbenzoic acid--CoA ligase